MYNPCIGCSRVNVYNYFSFFASQNTPSRNLITHDTIRITDCCVLWSRHTNNLLLFDISVFNFYCKFWQKVWWIIVCYLKCVSYATKYFQCFHQSLTIFIVHFVRHIFFLVQRAEAMIAWDTHLGSKRCWLHLPSSACRWLQRLYILSLLFYELPEAFWKGQILNGIRFYP